VRPDFAETFRKVERKLQVISAAWNASGSIVASCLLGAAGRPPIGDFDMTERPGAIRSEQIGSMHGEVDEAQALCSELDAVYAAAPVALASMTTELMFRRVNEHFAKLHGKQISQFIGKSLSAVLPDHAVAAEAAARQIIKTGEPLHDVSILRSQASEAEHYTESWFPHKSADGRIVGITIMAREAADYARGDRGITPALIAS